jgi:hypothetical protein
MCIHIVYMCYDPDVVQNYTYKPFGVVVKSGEEITLEYSFMAHPELEPADYTLAHTVFYHSDVEAFSSTFFNQVRRELLI